MTPFELQAIALLTEIRDLLAARREPKPRAPASGEADAVRAFVEAWNRHRGRLPKAHAVPLGQRAGRIAAALQAEPRLERWESAMKALASSPFHLGENGRGWKATIDFLVQPSQYPKWLEAGDEKAAAPAPAEQVWCVACSNRQATYGPGTRNPAVAEKPMCLTCWENA